MFAEDFSAEGLLGTGGSGSRWPVAVWRVPLAEGTLELVLHNLFDEVTQAKVLTLTDNLPTGYHAVVGQASGKGIRRGVVGDGAVGFLATHTAGLFGSAAVILLGHHDDRLLVRKQLSARRRPAAG